MCSDDVQRKCCPTSAWKEAVPAPKILVRLGRTWRPLANWLSGRVRGPNFICDPRFGSLIQFNTHFIVDSWRYSNVLTSKSTFGGSTFEMDDALNRAWLRSRCG